MQRLSYLTETVLSNKISSNRLVLSFKDSPRKPLRRRPCVALPPFPLSLNGFLGRRRQMVSLLSPSLSISLPPPIRGKILGQYIPQSLEFRGASYQSNLVCGSNKFYARTSNYVLEVLGLCREDVRWQDIHVLNFSLSSIPGKNQDPNSTFITCNSCFPLR